MNIKKLLAFLITSTLIISSLCACQQKDEFIFEEYDPLTSKYDLSEALSSESLKDLSKDYFKFGFGLTGNKKENAAVNSPEYMALVKHHANSVTLTNLMKSNYLLDQEGSVKLAEKGNEAEVAVRFDSVDPTLSWCYQNGVQMRGHTLVWHNQVPEWFFKEGYNDDGEYVDKETMTARLDSYIKQVVTYCQEKYPGVIYCWDVVNEAVDIKSGDKDTDFSCRTKYDETKDNPWYITLGSDYVELAYKSARKYCDPEVKLFYNDFNVYQAEKLEAVYNLCKGLHDKGLLDGVGLQDCWGLDFPSLKTIETEINTLSDIGIEIHCSEMAISVDKLSIDNFERQAKRYEEIFTLLQKLDTTGGGNADITCVTIFGLQDGFIFYDNDKTNYCLFDSEFKPKPCFYSIQKVLDELYYVWE